MNDFGVSGVMINVLLAAILFTDVTTHTFTHTYSSYAYIVFLSHILCHFSHISISISLTFSDSTLCVQTQRQSCALTVWSSACALLAGG